MRLEKHTVRMAQLMCNKGGEDGVQELLPCASVMRDWHEPQAVGTLPVLLPQSEFRGWNCPVWPQADASLAEQ